MFTALIAGLCALVLEQPGHALVIVGAVNGQDCAPFLSLADTKGKTTARIDPNAPLNPMSPQGHTYRVDMHRGGATLYVDGQPFEMPRGEPA